MTRFLLAVVAVTLAVSGLTAAPVPADSGKGTVFPYPAKAPVVVCLNGYDRARDRLGKMLTNAIPNDAANLTKTVDKFLNDFLEGRKLTGIRKDARAFVVVNELTGIPEGNFALAVLVPITSYKEFRDTFL